MVATRKPSSTPEPEADFSDYTGFLLQVAHFFPGVFFNSGFASIIIWVGIRFIGLTPAKG